MKTILKCRFEDLDEILKLQKVCYRENGIRHQNLQMQPLVQSIEEIQAEFAFSHIFKYVKKGEIMGSVRGYQTADVCYIFKLIVHPTEQNKGVGTKLLQKIEQKFKQVKKYSLVTAAKDEKNIYLYLKNGYKIVGTKKDDGIDFFVMEKEQHPNLQP